MQQLRPSFASGNQKSISVSNIQMSVSFYGAFNIRFVEDKSAWHILYIHSTAVCNRKLIDSPNTAQRAFLEFYYCGVKRGGGGWATLNSVVLRQPCKCPSENYKRLRITC